MRFDYEETVARWWLSVMWDERVSAGVNVRRFRDWWMEGEG